MVKATGRYFCDFLQSVDNIHLQMRFTYRKMKSPSMQITEVDVNGAVLIYRSTRSGFSKYLMGEIRVFRPNCLNVIPLPWPECRTTSRNSERDLWVGLESEDSRSGKRHQGRHGGAHRPRQRPEVRRSEVSLRLWQLGIRNDTEIRRESQKFLITKFFLSIMNYMCCLHQINLNHPFTITKH